MLPRERGGLREVEPGPEQVRDEERAGARRHGCLELVPPRGHGVEIEVDRDRDEPVRAHDGRHVRVRHRRDEDLVARFKVERRQEAVEPGPDGQARQPLVALRPRARDPRRAPVRIARRRRRADPEEDVRDRDVEPVARDDHAAAFRSAAAQAVRTSPTLGFGRGERLVPSESTSGKPVFTASLASLQSLTISVLIRPVASV